MLRDKPRQTLARLRLQMIELGITIERKDALVNVLAIQGHQRAAARELAWLNLHVERFEELCRQCRAMADEATAEYLTRLSRQIPYRPSDSLDQETATPTHRATEISKLIISMNKAELIAPELNILDDMSGL